MLVLYKIILLIYLTNYYINAYLTIIAVLDKGGLMKILGERGPHGLAAGNFNLYKNNKGFTLIELFVVLAIMSILLVLSYSTLRVPKEKIACKNIFSALQLARMRAITTGYNAYVDFDMDGGDVSDKYYTVYLDTDNDKKFGEKNNANGENEFTASHFTMQDSWQDSGGESFTAVALPSGVAFGLPTTNPPSSTPTNGSFSKGVLSNGVGFAGGSKRIKFSPKGMPSGFGGSIYVYNTNDSIGRSCAVVVASTGIIRMWTWDGNKWN